MLAPVLAFSLPAQVSNAYLDARVCAACHPKIAQSYARTGMARAFARAGIAGEDLSRGNPFFHEASGSWYAMLQRDGKLYQRRWRTGPDGRETAVQELSVDYVMGSGNHARTYLHRTARGTLVALPLGWYSENGGTWAMSPGQDRDYTLPPRIVAYECMFCHNAYPRIPAGHDEVGSEPLYTGTLPEGIDCQRCHGPGGNHVRAAQSGAAAAAVRQAIVNPARLVPERQMDVCMQCHLQTTSQPLPNAIRKYGRSPFSYQPAEPLGSFEVFFDRAPGTGDENNFEIAHSAYRLRKSQCFLRSNGKVTCITCHNPHEDTADFNKVCAGCHTMAPAHAATNDCTGCHMPKRRTQDVVHVVMTDHLIARRPPPGDLLAPLAERPEVGKQGNVVQYYPPQPEPLYLAVAKGLPQLAARPFDRPEYFIELGQAWIAAGNRAKAIPAFEEAIRREPDSPVALLGLGDALTQAGLQARAVSVLSHGVKVAPNDPLLWYLLGVVQSSAAAFQKAIALDPQMADAHNQLGVALEDQGDLDGAEREFLKALEAYPDLPDALGNLAHLLAARGDLPQAAFYFARSVKLNPNVAEVRSNYAVTLASLNRFDDARREIDAAVKADPQSPEAHNFRGTLLARQGDLDQAIREYAEAIRLRPDFGLAHLNAGRILASKGDQAGAEQHIRRALADEDPNLRRQAAAELQRLGVR